MDRILQKLKIYMAVFFFCYLGYFLQHFYLSSRNTSCMVSVRESKRSVLLNDESLQSFYHHISQQKKIKQQKGTYDYKMKPYRDPRWRSKERKHQLLLLSYKNAGSTYLGDVLRQNPGIFYVYHPIVVLSDYIEEYRGELMYLYKKMGGLRRKDLRAHRIENLTAVSNNTMKQLTKDLITNFLACNFTQVDFTSLSNLPYFHGAQTRTFSDCIQGGSLVSYIKCFQLLYEACNKTEVTLVNSVQLPVKTAKSLLSENPTLKLIYLYRDPRAILWTQFNSGVYKWATLRKKAEIFCKSLHRDLMEARNITKLFPKQFISVKFENLVDKTEETLRSMHQRLELGDVSKSVEDYITTGNRLVGCGDCVELNYDSWRLGMPYKGAGIIDIQCARVYQKLGYNLILGQDHLRDVNQTLEYESTFL